MQVTVSSEVAQTIRLRAALDSVTPGTVIEQAIIATNVRQGVMSQLSHGLHELKPSLTSRTRTKETKAARPKAKPTAAPPEGDEWTQEKIHEAMAREGLTGRALAEKLVSKKGAAPPGVQVNRWSRGAEKIPSHYWGQLDQVFGGEK